MSKPRRSEWCGEATGRTRTRWTNRTTPSSLTCSLTGRPARRLVAAFWSRTRKLSMASRSPAENQMKEIAEIVEADLNRAEHQNDVLALTAAYALDPMGNGGPLSTESLERLIPGLKSHPTTLIFLAYVEGKAVGIATCFRGFSTFRARPLIIIHDLAVRPEHRGR